MKLPIPENNYAVEAYAEGPWVYIRYQEFKDSEVFTYAIPHHNVNFIQFKTETT